MVRFCKLTCDTYNLVIIFYCKWTSQWRANIASVEFDVTLFQECIPFVYEFALELVFGEGSNCALVFPNICQNSCIHDTSIDAHLFLHLI